MLSNWHNFPFGGPVGNRDVLQQKIILKMGQVYYPLDSNAIHCDVCNVADSSIVKELPKGNKNPFDFVAIPASFCFNEKIH